MMERGRDHLQNDTRRDQSYIYLSNATAKAVWNRTGQANSAFASFPHLLHLTGSLFIKLIFQAGMVWALCKASLTRLSLSLVMEKKMSHAEIWKWDLGLQAPRSNLVLASWKKLPVCEFST